ncbi:stimulator of interferon genes protein-like [Saccostrea cucullata]|uniref:stimulator of interferon genes protein-like n=1 Tax=Saccostrea cuccullata TaxID=36930 RepID=UPI002ED0AD92
MDEIRAEGIAVIADEVLNLLTPQQRRTEVERFKYKIEEILNHSRNEECMGRARVLMFDDEGKGERNTPSYNLFNGVRNAIEETMMKPLSDRQPSHVTRSESNCSVDVCFLYSDIDAMENRTSVHSSPDNKTIKHIRMFLENKKIRCSIARPPVDSMGIIEERIKDARWVCCLVSVNTVRRKDFIEFWLAALLNDCIEKNQLKIIILLKDLDSSFIPNFIQWVTYIDISNEPSFEERIYEIIKGDVVTLRSQVPAGNVAFGLAWAFHVNYLRHVLPDFNERLESRMEQDDIRKFTAIKKKFKVSRSLLELIPKSCEFKPLLTMADDRIQGPFEVKPIVKQMAATKRVFPCKLYRIESENCDYYFAGEMLTPMKALSEMHKSMIAGLSKKQMYEQCDALVEQLSAILDSAATPEEMQKKCRCIKYDDTQRKLSDVIMEEIDKEQSRDHVEMYASWLKKQEK